jgi:hypothetical protein
MFSMTYGEARKRFLDAATAAKSELRASHQHPLRGPNGEKLFLDIVIWGSPDAARTLILASATHGIEGFVGSAIQTAFLRGKLIPPPQGVRVVLLHAINPYGFAWWRRVNEDGVDLNRNFINFAVPLPTNQAYTAEMAKALVPVDWDGADKRRADKWLSDWIKAHGADGLKRVVPVGQYEHWYAPFYGGWAPTWSNWTFRSVVRTHLSDCSGIVFIDYHSGLGEWGMGQLIGRDRADQAEASAGERLWGKEYVRSSEAGSVAYAVSGDLLSALHAELPAGAVLTSAAHEFGIKPIPDVLEALRFDHHLHVHGEPDPSRLVEQKALVRDAFCPMDGNWQAAVLDQAGRAIASALSADA